MLIQKGRYQSIVCISQEVLFKVLGITRAQPMVCEIPMKYRQSLVKTKSTKFYKLFHQLKVHFKLFTITAALYSTEYIFLAIWFGLKVNIFGLW